MLTLTIALAMTSILSPPRLGFFAPGESKDRTPLAYVAFVSGIQVRVTEDALAFVPSGSNSPAARVEFAFPRRGSLVAREPLPGRLNFFLGADPEKHRVDVEHFGRVDVRAVAPGIDVEVVLVEGGAEYDVVMHPGADPADLEFEVVGGDHVTIDPNGDLRLDLGDAFVVQRAPQTFGVAPSGARRACASRFEWRGPGRLGFALAAARDDERTVVDPGIATSTYLGSSLFDDAAGCVLDATEATIVCGTTNASSFPVTAGSYDTTFGGTFSDAFVAKLSATGTLVFATFLGGTGTDGANAIAVAPDGKIHVVGRTQSSDFPTTTGVVDSSQNGGSDGFCAALASDGKTLAYGSYLGGAFDDEATGVAIGTGNEIFVTGYTGSANFPSSAGAFDTSFAGGGPALTDGFVTRLAPLGQALTFSTFLGGVSLDEPRGIALSLGTPVVVGRTESIDFPIAGASHDPTFGGGVQDGFIAHLNALGTALTYSTFVGGFDFDGLECVSTHSDGRIFTGGFIRSQDTPIPVGFDLSPSGGEEGLVFVLGANDAFSFGGYVGGTGDDRIQAIAVDVAGAIYLTGRTLSTDFPALTASYDNTGNGSSDAFFSKLKTGGAGYNESGYLGGSGFDEGRGIAVASNGTARLVGRTTSTDFPIVPGAPQSTLKGSSDGFVTTLPTATCSNAPSALVYGSGKAGTTGIPTLTGIGLPAVPSSTFIVRINGALPGAVPILFVGATQIALPFDGGTFLVSPLFAITLFPIGVTGRLDLPVAFGDDANLCALELDLQAIYIDPGAPGYHHTVQTNGLEIVLGS